MSTIDDIKNKTRGKKPTTPATYMSEGINEETNVGRKEEIKTEPERKRVSFDLSKDLHQQLKVRSATNGKKIYEMIEEALHDYLNK